MPDSIPDSPPPWWADEDHGDPWVQAEQELANVAADAIDQVADQVPDQVPDQVAEGEVLDLSPRELSARRLTAIAALEKLLAKLKAQEKETGAWTRAGQKETVSLPTGQRLGHTRTDEVKGGWVVQDAGEWLAFVASHYPDKVVEVTTQAVDPAFTKTTLANLDVDTGEWPDPVTGEILGTPPGLEYKPAGYKIVTVADKDAPAAVAKFLGDVGQRLGLPELEAGK